MLSKWIYHWHIFSLLICLFFLFLANGWLKLISYEKYQLESFSKRKDNIQLTFETDKGKQAAFFVPPLLNQGIVPEKIGYVNALNADF